MTARRRPPRTGAASTLLIALSAACAAPAAAESSASKKELVARIVQLQRPGIEAVAQSLVERPAALMLQDAGQALQKRVAAERRGEAARRIQTSARRFVDETGPLVRERALSLAPGVFGAQLEADFSEAELAQLVGWLESPVARKYQRVLPGTQDSFMQQLVSDARPLVDPKLQRLEQEIRVALGLPPLDDKAAERPSAPPSPRK